MTISATSQGLKPGVCTSSNRPANPFTGMLIFETDTNRLAVYNGSAWVVLADADTPPGLELVKTQTIGTAVSSVEVTGAFSSTYDNYLITVNGGVGSTSANLSLKLGSTATGYYWTAQYQAYSNGAVTNDYGTNWDGFAYVGRCTTNSLSYECMVYDPFSTKTTHALYRSSDSSTSGYRFQGGGFLNNTTSYTAFTIAPNTGTITGGTIRVYGYRNS